MFSAYIPEDSVFPGSIYENPTNEKIKYDPDAAVKLLAEAALIARFEGHRSSHTLNNALLRALFADPGNYERIAV